ncbi:sulfotransferase 2B1 isoform X4 [Alligator mississippiensis]|uniref:sulfotransferase 2B1 isoform X4 n=1 Tax=Alligator mississippiensis TaxID=8496 RepID=UPI0028780DB9|nr:sulfotransferase 2B1 isoform X4 [Alligator mississippiensis]
MSHDEAGRDSMHAYQAKPLVGSGNKRKLEKAADWDKSRGDVQPDSGCKGSSGPADLYGAPVGRQLVWRWPRSTSPTRASSSPALIIPPRPSAMWRANSRCGMMTSSTSPTPSQVIYTLRSPKDVLTSLYHFSKALRLYKDPGPVDTFLQDFLSGSLPYGSWFDHVAGWLGLQGHKNFLCITYEELQQDPWDSVRRICHFLGKELSEQHISSVVENASFQTMRGNKMSNVSQLPDEYMDHSKGQLLRKGVCGDWKNLLSEEQSRCVDAEYREWMQALDITFPWD